MRVGIDLGTTSSLGACLGAEGRPVLIPDCSEPDVFQTPSVVHLARKVALVGGPAEALLEQDPHVPVLRFFKRLLGAPRPVCHDDSGAPWYPEAVSALLLKKLAFDAEAHCGRRPDPVVLAVPAYFNDPQRRAVLTAAALAELPVLGLVEAPAAAALHYCVAQRAVDQVLLVYDFGGGGFDATVVSMDARGVYVLAKTGVTELGGKELDEQVGGLILSQVAHARGREFARDHCLFPDLRRIAEQMKIELCAPGRTRVRRTVMLDGQAVEVEIARADFESAIRQHLDRAEAEALACLWDAGLRPRDVDRVLLVGGSSQVPRVAQRLRAVFSRPGQQVLHHEPSRAVAYGAALHATQLAGEAERYGVPRVLWGVSAHGVGIRTLDPAAASTGVDVLVAKNTPLPVHVTTACFTSRPNQERLVLDVVQFGEADGPVTSIGRLLVGLDAPRPRTRVHVALEYRRDGTVTVSASDSSGRELEQVLWRPGEEGRGGLEGQRSLVRSTTINRRIH